MIPEQAADVPDPSRHGAGRFRPAVLCLLVASLAGAVVAPVVIDGDPAAPARVSPDGSRRATPPFPDVARIELADAQARFDARTAVFVDVRKPEEYDEGHIPGAISLPVDADESRYRELPGGKEILTYCA